MPDRRSCASCFFYDPIVRPGDLATVVAVDSEEDPDQPWGYCRRRLPAGADRERSWPEVYAEDWCGEFRGDGEVLVLPIDMPRGGE